MTLEQKIENIPGNLRDAYKEAKKEVCTILCVDQLMNERRTDPVTETDEDLRNLCFYTADGEVYSVDEGVPTLRITREAVNPVLKNIDDAFDRSVNKKNYQVTPADFEAVKSAPDTVVIDLTKLRLEGSDNEWRYLAINTNGGYDSLNDEEKKVADRFSYTPENLRMLSESQQKITETRIYFLSPDYVKKEAKENPVGRASWLGDFNDGSCFFASDRLVGNYGRLRRVRLVEVAEGDARKNSSKPLDYKDHYHAILTNPDEAIRSLDDQTASGLLNNRFSVSGY